MSLKAQLEAIIYAAETPVTLDNMIHLVKDGVANGGPPDDAAIKSQVRVALEELSSDYANANHGIEIRQVASGYRMSTKPEHHDVVRAFAKSLKPPIRLSMPALETLAVIAYKQPVTVPEISEIRGVDSSGVIATLLDRKLITTAGRKAVIGRPILYKSTKEFLLRFGLKDVTELPSMEEFEKLVAESFQSDLLPATDGDAGDDTMTKNASRGSAKNDGVGGQHGKPNPGSVTPSEADALDTAPDGGSTGSGTDDGVGGQHGKPNPGSAVGVESNGVGGQHGKPSNG